MQFKHVVTLSLLFIGIKQKTLNQFQGKIIPKSSSQLCLDTIQN
jgi:hypothetical protein